ncbi:MAG: murein biosynthesis integral membrane protein MurJ [Ilumatobacteraceae bacterium]
MANFVRSNLIVASGTACSRATGLLRVIVLAYVLGQNALSDAYKLANETPNIVYDLIIGGVLSATLVPVFTSLIVQERRNDENERGFHAVVSASLLASAALAAVAVVLAPVIFRLYSLKTAASVDAETFRTAGTMLTRLFVIQVLFYGVTGVMTAVLHASRRFLAAAWAPVASNLVIIATLLTLPEAGSTTWELSDISTNSRLYLTLGLGATGGIALMAIITTGAALRGPIALKWHFDLQHPAVRRVAKMSGWTLGFVVANQIALVVIRNLADPGSSLASAYFDAFMFFVLPHGLLAVSIATTLQPELARAVSENRPERFTTLIKSGIRAIVALTAPASVGLIVIGPTAIASLMQRGQFDAVAADNTSRALTGLAIGLTGFSVYLFTLRGFYAHADTKTPFMLNVGENGLNILLAVVFVGPLGVFGLGLSLGVAYVVSALVGIAVLRRKYATNLGLSAITRESATLGLAAITAGLCTWGVMSALNADSWTGNSGILGAVAMSILLLALYGGFASALKVNLRGVLTLDD